MICTPIVCFHVNPHSLVKRNIFCIPQITMFNIFCFLIACSQSYWLFKNSFILWEWVTHVIGKYACRYLKHYILDRLFIHLCISSSLSPLLCKIIWKRSAPVYNLKILDCFYVLHKTNQLQKKVNWKCIMQFKTNTSIYFIIFSTSPF